MSGRYVFPKRYADAVARLRVPFGFLLVAAFGWLARPTRESLWIGIPISAAGLILRGWAAGHLHKNQRLAIGGPYRFTRNPLYLGTLLVAAGLAVATRRAALAVLFGAVFFLIYLPAIQLEEEHLRQLFREYAKYAERVPRLIGIPRRAGLDGERFEMRTYLRNEEYQALAGLIAGVLFLVWRASY